MFAIIFSSKMNEKLYHLEDIGDGNEYLIPRKWSDIWNLLWSPLFGG